MKVSKEKIFKEEIKDWWSRHSQDYVDPGEEDHLGIDLNLSDKDFRNVLRKSDKNFFLDAYFAQDKNKNFFSKLIPNDLKHKKILEIGCGLGAHTELFSLKKSNVTSIDLAPTSIKVTKRRLSIKKLKANVIEADAENLPFPDNSFDIIWSWGVIHHSPNTKKCAEEIERVLTKRGKLYIMLYNKNSMYNWINVIFRYGILKGKLFSMSIQDLHNRYTDGKSGNGAPLSKYYTRKQIKEDLFPNLNIISQTCFEKKHVFSFWVPASLRRKFETLIPDKLHSWIWSRVGFLLFTIAEKR